MRTIALILLLAVLLLGFIGSTMAAYRGVGLVSSGNPTSRSVFVPIFIGGGPGSGK